MANPSANNTNGNGSAATAANGGSSAVPENSPTGPSERALKHPIGLSFEWTRDEQSLLEELLTKYASDKPVMRFAKIAEQLQDKTVRDVALRTRWMTIAFQILNFTEFVWIVLGVLGYSFKITGKKENGKRRKDNSNSSRRHKDKKEKVADQQAKPSSNTANRSNGPQYAQPSTSIDSDDGISYKDIGGASGQLLEQNAQALDQILANFSTFKVQENIHLFSQTRNNILAIMNDLTDMPEMMKQMPPLPVKLNDELASSILP
uniref:uncharacterized protein LOC122582176 isoform X1 n=1 Tax=Erigeron canadensis TaxID=72917 RepID=UPI001CB949C1|nr:uncharacterized protein LOC122582176 isoform X1 [Erigeron canadensis]